MWGPDALQCQALSEAHDSHACTAHAAAAFGPGSSCERRLWPNGSVKPVAAVWQVRVQPLCYNDDHADVVTYNVGCTPAELSLLSCVDVRP